jgi:tetratricopeptide (TPR) repeat protein
LNGPLRAAIRADIDAQSPDPHETLLSEQLDSIRDTGKGKPPAVNLPVFEAFLGSLPRSASGVIRFRAKANIGLQHLQAGDHDQAARWLLDAYEEAPTDHRATANKALAMWLRGEFEAAYRYGREQLAAHPANQALAGYLPQIAASVPEVVDGLEGVPEQLKSTEPVALAHIQFLRMRDARPDWWIAAREAAARHPESKTLRVLSAVADVDEIARDEEFQRKRYISPAQKATLRDAVAILDADWESKIWLLSNPYDDALNIFAAALVAHFFLNDTNRTMELIEHLVDAGVSNSAVLLDAANMAHSLGNTPLAKRVIACAPDDPQLMFPAAAIAMEAGDWGAAATLLEKAVIPDTEQHITKIILRLAPLVEARKRGELDDPAPTLKEILKEAQGSPRSLVLVASVATKLGSRRLGQRAFKAAVDAVSDESHIATRLMVAAYAERVRSSAGVIRLLDGHLPAEGFERDHERLAVAHANERPHRKRNLAFFQQLAPEILKRREISRAHANVLMNVGLLRDALPLLRKLHSDDPTDTFITLRLLDALRRAGDRSGVSAVLRKLDLSAAEGQPLHVMSLAHLIAREGETERAYAKAYDLVRTNSTDPDVVLGYLEIGILSGARDFGAQPATVEVGTGVRRHDKLPP